MYNITAYAITTIYRYHIIIPNTICMYVCVSRSMIAYTVAYHSKQRRLTYTRKLSDQSNINIINAQLVVIHLSQCMLTSYKEITRHTIAYIITLHNTTTLLLYITSSISYHHLCYEHITTVAMTIQYREHLIHSREPTCL